MVPFGATTFLRLQLSKEVTNRQVTDLTRMALRAAFFSPNRAASFAMAYSFSSFFFSCATAPEITGGVRLMSDGERSDFGVDIAVTFSEIISMRAGKPSRAFDFGAPSWLLLRASEEVTDHQVKDLIRWASRCYSLLHIASHLSQ